MKKEIIQTWSTMLVIVMLALSLTACNFNSGVTGNFDSVVNGNHQTHYLFPEGYTGGFYHQPGANIEYWWVETYEECMAAIESLESHDSTFVKSAIFTYEGDLFDTKYCIKIPASILITEKINFGDDPFDRRGGGVEVFSYAFFEDVTIDEINHSYVDNFDFTSMHIWDLDDAEDPYLSLINSHLIWNDQYRRFEVIDSESNIVLIRMGSFNYFDNPENALNCAEKVHESIVLIGFD